MPLNAVTRSLGRRRANSQVSISILPPSPPPKVVEEDDIIIRFDFALRDSIMGYMDPMSPDDGSFDIGELPMAILTRGASAQDPVTMISPHVHVIYGRRMSVDDGAAPPNRGSWSRGPTSSCKPSSSGCANAYQRTPRLLRRRSSTRFSSLSALECELSTINETKCHGPDPVGIPRTVSLRKQRSSSILASSPLPTIKPLQIRRRKSRANCALSLDMAHDSFPPVPPTASPTRTMFADYPNSPAERWSATTSTPIDWDLIETTLGCHDVKLADLTEERNCKQKKPDAIKSNKILPEEGANRRKAPLEDMNVDRDSFLDVEPEPTCSAKLERRKVVVRRKARCS